MNHHIAKVLPGLLCALAFTGHLYADDLLEPNDTFGTAIELTLDTPHALTGANEDWFKFSNLNPGLLRLVMDPTLPAALVDDLNMILYLSDGVTVVAANLLSNEIEEILYHVIIPGTYLVRVYPTNGGSNTYTLTASRSKTTTGDDGNEDNDSFDDPSPIPDYNQTITGQVAKDDDWFSFLAPPGTITLSITYDGSTDLVLEGYNSSGGRLNNTTGSSGTASLELDIADEDTLYVAVSGGDGANYTLSIDHPVLWYSTLTTGPNSAASPTIIDLDADGKGEILIGSVPYLVGDPPVESKPAALVCLEDDGSEKWTVSFPAASIADPVTGVTYSTTAISSRPAVGDVDGDGDLEVVVGVGVDLDFIKPGTVSDVYSPGHKGGVYVIDALTGAIEWSRISLDTIGGASNTGDLLEDGVISSPVICDVNQDGLQEIIWGGWDQRVYVVDGRDGSNFGSVAGSKWPVNVHDTNWSTPLCADINNDGLHEVLIGGDVTENPAALTLTGGLFHVYDRWGRDIIDGFGELIEFDPGSGDFSFLKGKYEEQTIWSSPIAADIDSDGNLEIAYGTGLFADFPTGNFIRIWNHDGSEYLKLTTQGRTFAVPLFADIDNDGDLEIIAVTTKGWVHAWDHIGNPLFSTHTFGSGATGVEEHPIYSAPLAVDMDGDGDLEIIYQQGVSITVVDHTGLMLTDYTKWGMTNENWRGTPAIGDLDGDGNLEIITGGTNDARDAGVVYAFRYGTVGNATATGGSYNYARRQFRENGVVPVSATQVSRRIEVSNFVTRFYQEVLGRAPDSWGLSDWTNRLLEGDRSGGDVGRGFILSTEFINQGKTDAEFLTIMYLAFFNRVPDTGGYDGWYALMQSGTSRAAVLDGFIGAQEFLNLSNFFNITGEFTATQGLSRVPIEEFVTRFYNQILLRAPDAPGLAGWTDALMNGSQTGAGVANGFINSPEFIARGLDNTAYVNVLYRAFFGRSADPSGLSGWVTALDSAAATRQQVLEGFVGSQEFINLAAEFGISAS